MEKKSIVLHLSNYTYGEVATFAQDIHDNLATSAIYVSPVPSLPVQLAAINILKAAVIAHGVKGNRGSKVDFGNLLTAFKAVCKNLQAVANYCMAITPNDASAWVNVGFSPKKKGGMVGMLPVVQEFRQYTLGVIPQGCIKLKWKKPAAAPKYLRISYRVMRSADRDFNNATQVAVTTKTSHIDNLDGLAHVQYYWVVPVNAYGDGVPSQEVAAGVLRLY